MQGQLIPPKVIDSFSGDYRFLSNFYPSPITAHGIVYPTVEHVFQAAKTLRIVERQVIASLPTPGQAKRAGRRLELRPGWNAMRIDVMAWCLAQKFAVGSDLADRLMQTHPADLVEGNTWGDRFWGVCDGRGQNHLGKLLMARRSALRPADDPVDVEF